MFWPMFWQATSSAPPPNLPPPFLEEITPVPTEPPSVLSATLLQAVRTSLSAAALRLTRALDVDQARALFSNLGESERNALNERILTSLTRLTDIEKMQRALFLMENPSAVCSHVFFTGLRRQFQAVHSLRITTRSPLQAGFTLSFVFNHQDLVNVGLSLASANDLRIYYQPSTDQSPVEVHRVIEGLGTAAAILNFALINPLPADSVIDGHYAIVFGNPMADEALCDPRLVFALYEDFSTDSQFPGTAWTVQQGSWLVNNGYLQGNTSGEDFARTLAVFYAGESWSDFEFQMDVWSDEGAGEVAPLGVFLRAQQNSPGDTVAWYVQHSSTTNSSALFGVRDGSHLLRFSAGQLPLSSREQSRWHRLRFSVLERQIPSQLTADQSGVTSRCLSSILWKAAP